MRHCFFGEMMQMDPFAVPQRMAPARTDTWAALLLAASLGLAGCASTANDFKFLDLTPVGPEFTPRVFGGGPAPDLLRLRFTSSTKLSDFGSARYSLSFCPYNTDFQVAFGGPRHNSQLAGSRDDDYTNETPPYIYEAYFAYRWQWGAAPRLPGAIPKWRRNPLPPQTADLCARVDVTGLPPKFRSNVFVIPRTALDTALAALPPGARQVYTAEPDDANQTQMSGLPVEGESPGYVVQVLYKPITIAGKEQANWVVEGDFMGRLIHVERPTEIEALRAWRAEAEARSDGGGG
jgi:hypothetical protein